VVAMPHFLFLGLKIAFNISLTQPEPYTWKWEVETLIITFGGSSDEEILNPNINETTIATVVIHKEKDKPLSFFFSQTLKSFYMKYLLIIIGMFLCVLETFGQKYGEVVTNFTIMGRTYIRTDITGTIIEAKDNTLGKQTFVCYDKYGVPGCMFTLEGAIEKRDDENYQSEADKMMTVVAQSVFSKTRLQELVPEVSMSMSLRADNAGNVLEIVFFISPNSKITPTEIYYLEKKIKEKVKFKYLVNEYVNSPYVPLYYGFSFEDLLLK
jgi:hypothetical protein